MKLVGAIVRIGASGIPWYVAGMILFAGMDVISKTLVQTLPLAGILWVRYIFYAGFGLILVLKLSGLKGLKSKTPFVQCGRGLAMLFDVALFVLSFRFLQLAEAHSIAAIAPLMVTALAVPMLGERVGRRRWSAVLLGFGGVLIILRPGSDIFQPAAILPLIGTFEFFTLSYFDKNCFSPRWFGHNRILPRLDWFGNPQPNRSIPVAEPDVRGMVSFGFSESFGRGRPYLRHSRVVSL
ncbi:MAG: hypothetical protein CM1200mP4_2840 [Rhodospirillaceae bacterium]|nr:MAG: hypothetical protein CM1200mP4_2840 [Rhodospirillaceae bacterium]